ncbi:uncharacterized protein LOC115924151 [Strongylocentrotus purpuratus]|uniref:Apple domain-containing protein n=1 Tax=Strongylocentrotus purpuratus TaxID=7668 RepID=A0A7M7NUV0_STRPU|nr:uncharacterized protein LOC115924151 [Strongylocentrotus purpuratus]
MSSVGLRNLVVGWKGYSLPIIASFNARLFNAILIPNIGVRGETTVPTRSTSGTPETPTEYRTPTPDFTTIHQALPTIPSQADIVHQKTSLFKRIEGRRLQNHMIKTKHGLSLVKCGAECNKRDDCVSFNIGNGVCELNNQVVGGTGVDKADFVDDEEFKYYEKQ